MQTKMSLKSSCQKNKYQNRFVALKTVYMGLLLGCISPLSAQSGTTTSSPYTPDVLRNAWLAGVGDLENNASASVKSFISRYDTPEHRTKDGLNDILNNNYNEDSGLIKLTYYAIHLDAQSAADKFAMQTDLFNSPLQQNYQLQPQDMYINALHLAIQRTDNKSLFDQLYRMVFYNNNNLTKNIFTQLSSNIITHLPALNSMPYKEPGINVDVHQRLNAGESWDAITRNWDKNAGSWKTPEALNNWGLDLTGAYYAYALGITGKDVSVGILDSGILTSHREFQDKNQQGQARIQTVNVSGTFYADHPRYSKNDAIGKTGEFHQGEPFTLSGVYNPEINDSHGTLMAGLIAASRDGNGMQGVAFNASLFMANTGGTDDNRPRGSDDLDYNVWQASYAALAAKNVILVNNSWGNNSRDPIEANFGEIQGDYATNLRIMKNAFRPFWDKNQSGHKTWLDAMRESVGKYPFIQVDATGNENLVANPLIDDMLPWFYPDLESQWLSVTGFDEDNAQVYSSCGNAKWWCVMGVSGMPSTTEDGGYMVNANGTSSAAPNISGDMALLAERFHYMTPAQLREVLLTTSTLQERDSADFSDADNCETGIRTYGCLTPIHSIAPDKPQIPNEFGWGLPNMKKAMQGFGQFTGNMLADLPAGTRDIWENSISDEAVRARRLEHNQEQAQWQQTKQEKGWLNGLPASASADDQFDYDIGERREQATHRMATDPLNGQTYTGSLTKQGDGELVLTGNNSYHGSTFIRGGTLSVDGTLSHSSVTIDNSGIGQVSPVTGFATTHGGVLAGNGQLQTVIVNAGGTVSPGHSIGRLHTGDITFNPGSVYLVEIDTNGQNDVIESQGKARLNGGTIDISLLNNTNLLATKQLPDITSQQYHILTASHGIDGQFDNVSWRKLFIDAGLNYKNDGITLHITRNSRNFASTANSRNQRALAHALEVLPINHSVQQSILLLSTTNQARHAFRQLSGQIHADIASALLNNSHYLRDTLNERLWQAQGLSPATEIQADNDGIWGSLQGAWSHVAADSNAFGYRASTYGALFGVDRPLGANTHIGLATGYTRTQLHNDNLASAKIDSIPLALYASRQWGAWSLHTGAAYHWYHNNTSRTVAYASGFGQEKSDYHASSGQFFVQTGYTWQTDRGHIEPFADIAYQLYRNNAFSEWGNAAALQGDRHITHTTTSALGLRADKLWLISKNSRLLVAGEAGWLHQYPPYATGAALNFNHPDSQFVVYSSHASHNNLALKLRTEIILNNNSRLSVSYQGLLSAHYQDNSIHAGFTQRF